MKVTDIWPGNDIADQIGHAAGAWDCPCGPWVLTDMDEGDEGVRTVRHVAFCPTCGVAAAVPD
jgi:hypothetical protein